MKKKRKKTSKTRKKISNLKKSAKNIKIKIKKRKKITKSKKLKKSKKHKKKSKKIILKKPLKKRSENLISKSVRLEENIKSNFGFKFKIDFLAIDRFIAKFFQKIEEKIQKFKLLRFEEKRRLKLEAIEKAELEKLKKEKEKKEEEELQFKIKEKQLKDGGPLWRSFEANKRLAKKFGSDVPYHPAAIKYYKDVGLLK